MEVKQSVLPAFASSPGLTSLLRDPSRHPLLPFALDDGSKERARSVALLDFVGYHELEKASAVVRIPLMDGGIFLLLFHQGSRCNRL